MNKFDLKAWTGPVSACEIAKACRDAGFIGARAGTEHVYIEGVMGTNFTEVVVGVMRAIRMTHKRDFGLWFKQI